MAKKPATVKAGGACPSCPHGTLEAAIVPSKEQYEAAFDRENPTGLPDGYDTAAPAQRDKIGALSVCSRCGYRHRDASASSEAA